VRHASLVTDARLGSLAVGTIYAPRIRIFGSPLPGPAAFNFCLQRETKESTDDHQRGEQPKALKRERSANRQDDVCANHPFKAEQNTTSNRRRGGLLVMISVGRADANTARFFVDQNKWPFLKFQVSLVHFSRPAQAGIRKLVV